MVVQACPDEKLLAQLLLGQLPLNQVEEIADHVEVCEECLKRMEAFQDNDQLLQDLGTPSSYGNSGEFTDSMLENARKLRSEAETSLFDQTVDTDYNDPKGKTLIVSPSRDAKPSQTDATGEDLGFLHPPIQPNDLGCLGGYRVIEVLGVGGMGLVFRAVDAKLDRMLALKAMKPSIAIRPTAKDRFLQEAKATAAIEHDNVIQIYEVGEDNGVPYIAMPFLEGQSVESILEKGKQLTQLHVVRIAKHVASGLAAAHESGLIHRDIKPDNIWLDKKSKRAKILDFGLARLDEQAGKLTHSGQVIGTPKYMSPEQAAGEKVDFRSDLFSLGTVMYHLLAKQAPFEANSLTAILLKVSEVRAQPIEEHCPDIHPELSALIRHLMAKFPAQRPASTKEVVTKLTQIEQQLKGGPASNALSPTILKTDDDPSALKRRREQQSSSSFIRKPRTLIAAGVIGFVLLFGIVMMFQTPKGTIRVETIGDLEGLEVYVDDEKLVLNTDEKFASNKKHELALKLNGARLKLDPETNEFIIDEDNRLAVQLGSLQLSDDSFTITRGETEVLTIELLPAAPPLVNNDPQPALDQGDGWDYLIDPTLSKWVSRQLGTPEDGSRVSNGVIRLFDKGHYSFRTKKQYADFELEFEWASNRHGNAFVAYRADPILDPAEGSRGGIMYKLGHFDRQNQPSTGEVSLSGVFGVVAPQRPSFKPIREWNTSRIVARGKHIEHWLNGKKVCEATIGTPEWKAAARKNRQTGPFSNYGECPEGYIVLTEHNNDVFIRNMRVRELTVLQANEHSATSRHSPLFIEAHGLSKTELKRWLDTIPKNYIPKHINLRWGAPELIFDIVAEQNPTEKSWLVNFFDDNEEALRLSGTYRFSHTLYWRLLFPTNGIPPKEGPGLRIRWEDAGEVYKPAEVDNQDFQQAVTTYSNRKWLPMSLCVTQSGDQVNHFFLGHQRGDVAHESFVTYVGRIQIQSGNLQRTWLAAPLFPIGGGNPNTASLMRLPRKQRPFRLGDVICTFRRRIRIYFVAATTIRMVSQLSRFVH